MTKLTKSDQASSAEMSGAYAAAIETIVNSHKSRVTKGQWVSSARLDSSDSTYIESTIDGEQLTIAKVYGHDAAYYDAAPDLYEALEMMMEIAGPIEFNKDYCPVESIKIKARIALAKARGEK